MIQVTLACCDSAIRICENPEFWRMMLSVIQGDILLRLATSHPEPDIVELILKALRSK